MNLKIAAFNLLYSGVLFGQQAGQSTGGDLPAAFDRKIRLR